MTKAEIVKRLCMLANEVGIHLDALGISKARDCFCEDAPKHLQGFGFQEDIVLFIESAVKQAMSPTQSYRARVVSNKR
jgi:hypothetical protein